MGSGHSGDHIARDDARTDITGCNIEEPQQDHRPRTASNRSVGFGRLKPALLGRNPHIPTPLWFKTPSPDEGCLTYQGTNIGNKTVSDKTYDEQEKRT